MTHDNSHEYRADDRLARRHVGPKDHVEPEGRLEVLKPAWSVVRKPLHPGHGDLD